MVSISQFDSLVETRSLLKHPFYVKWSKGELTLDDLRVYAKEYFHLAKRIPGIVARVRERAVDRDASILEHIEENMREEQEHVELWKRFARSLGISEKELAAYRPSKQTLEAVSKLEKVAEQSFDHGVAAMYALELELPKIAKTKKDGLCTFYGLVDEDAHVYFDAHLREEEHLKVWRSITVDMQNAEEAVEQSLDAQNEILDSVCGECGICTDC